MPRIDVAESALIPAEPPVVYRILADYRIGHPAILPPRTFFDLVVERGGYGAGTVIRFSMRLAGVTRVVRGEVSEPDPGRLLVETYPDTGTVTSFTVDPQGDHESIVTIRTEWEPVGFRGVVESLLAPRLLRGVYVEELKRLARFASDRERFRSSRKSD
jgi:hypothetical protein